MRPTGDGGRPGPAPAGWQAPLEADPVDAQEQIRDIVDGSDDPESPVVVEPPGDLDFARASEADLADQSVEVAFDDDGER